MNVCVCPLRTFKFNFLVGLKIRATKLVISAIEISAASIDGCLGVKSHADFEFDIKSEHKLKWWVLQSFYCSKIREIFVFACPTHCHDVCLQRSWCFRVAEGSRSTATLFTCLIDVARDSSIARSGSFRWRVNFQGT